MRGCSLPGTAVKIPAWAESCLLGLSGCTSVVASMSVRTPRGHLSNADVVSFNDMVAEVQFILQAVGRDDLESYWAVVKPFESASDGGWLATTGYPALAAVSLLSSPMCVFIAQGKLVM